MANVSSGDEVNIAVPDGELEMLWPSYVTCINEQGYLNLITMMDFQLKSIASDPKLAHANFSHILSWYMNMMEMEPKVRQAEKPELKPTPSDPLQMKPIVVNQDSISERQKVELKKNCLKVLNALVKQEKKSRLFSFWFAFMPDASVSPYKKAIFDLLHHSDPDVQLSTLKLVQIYFEKSSTYLLLANYHCRTTSFTPVCYHFARSLRMTVMNVCKCYDWKTLHCNVYSVVAKTLVVLLEEVPFHRLQAGVIEQICFRLLCLKGDANPVVQIGVMQVCLGLMSIETDAKDEIRGMFDDFFGMFLDRMVPNASMTEGVTDMTPPRFEMDYNICYFAVQCMGKLANLDLGKFMSKLDDLPLIKVLENVIEYEKDRGYTLSLHMIRLFRTIGNSSYKMFDEERTEDKFLLERMVGFWKDFLRPSLLDLIEQKQMPILKAALCDCLSEIGEQVFSQLPTDRRILCLTYLLQKCTIFDDLPENRVVTTSQVRALGRCITWPSCNLDSAFVSDCAELVLDVLDRELRGGKFAHKNIALSGSWALANLAFALAMPGSSINENDEFLSSLSANNDQLEFPPHLTVGLTNVAIKYAENLSNLMDIRTSCVRALGCFFRSLDCIATNIEGTFEDLEFINVCRKVINTISMNASTGKAMKVRWNACYASANVLKPLSLFKNKVLKEARADLISNLLPMVEDFPNYKVRMAACTALLSATSMDTFDQRFLDVVMTVVKGLDTVNDADEESEAQHRSNLIDRLGLALCHLLNLADTSNILSVNKAFIEHTSDNLKTLLVLMINRATPEQGSLVLKTVSKMRTISAEVNKRSDDDLFAIFYELEETDSIGHISMIQ